MILSIDGREVEVPDASTVLDAAARSGARIPTLCHDERLAPTGACRLCLVEIQGVANPQPACATRVGPSMVVVTDSPALAEHRRAILGLLAASLAPRAASAPVSDLDRLLREYGVEARGGRRSDDLDASHPLIDVDMSRCILCARCVRICAEVQGQFVWQAVDRGNRAGIRPGIAATLADSPCVACGACVQTCPSGALSDRVTTDAGEAPARTRSVCPYCGVGCEIEIEVRTGQVSGIRPAPDAPANKGHLCVKGRYAFDFAASRERLREPLLRDASGALVAASWDDALAAAAQGLQRAIHHGGPAAVGVFGSSRATNEENYLIQKLARAVLGTNNVDSCARVCHAPTAEALRRVLGTGAATNSFADIDLARTIMVCGSNPTENHPVVGARIKQAVRSGARLVVVDPRRTELAGCADVFLQLRPGTNVALFNAMANVIITEGLADGDFIARRVEGLEELATAVSAWTPEAAAAACGVAAHDIRAAARLYASSGPSMCFHGLGLTEQHQGTEAVMALVNLALLTGNLGRRGTGMNPLRGQNNVQGAAHMGCEPSRLTGYAPIETARAVHEEVWGVEIPHGPGLDAMQMLDAAAEGTLRALLLFGWDIALTQPQTGRTEQALANLESLVVVDPFLNETARRHATVVLPAAVSYEKDGTFMSSERRVQRLHQALEPPGLAEPDWRIVEMLAAQLGRAELFDYSGTDEIWEEIRHVWHAGSGITAERLEEPGGVQWPCPEPGHPGTEILHIDSFPGIGEKARLSILDQVPLPEPPDEEFPLTLVTGRVLYQFNAGTMTSRSRVAVLHPTDVLEISPGDAETLGIADGQPVRVRSRHGHTVIAARLSDRVRIGEVFATFSDPAVWINRVTGGVRDPHTNTPAYKVTPVSVSPADPGS